MGNHPGMSYEEALEAESEQQPATDWEKTLQGYLDKFDIFLEGFCGLDEMQIKTIKIGVAKIYNPIIRQAIEDAEKRRTNEMVDLIETNSIGYGWGVNGEEIIEIIKLKYPQS